jgi:hypothetical protein
MLSKGNQMKFRQSLLLVFPLLTVACANLNGGPYKHSEGWRSGEIEEVSTAGAMPKHQPDDCREDASANYPASTPFALVSYQSNRMTKHRAMPLPKGLEVKAGDAVLVNLKQCEAALVADVTK